MVDKRPAVPSLCTLKELLSALKCPVRAGRAGTTLVSHLPCCVQGGNQGQSGLLLTASPVMLMPSRLFHRIFHTVLTGGPRTPKGFSFLSRNSTHFDQFGLNPVCCECEHVGTCLQSPCRCGQLGSTKPRVSPLYFLSSTPVIRATAAESTENHPPSRPQQISFTLPSHE